jgi:TonB family protein
VIEVPTNLAKIANLIGGFKCVTSSLAFYPVSFFFLPYRGHKMHPRACDLAAASSYDPTRPADIPGVDSDKIDPKIAIPACEAALAADPNNPQLLFQMGRASFAGKDETRARTFYERSAAQGHAGAQNNLAVFYEAGWGGLPNDDQQAARLFKLAADSGEPNAQYSLGNFYETGRAGLAKSDQAAARLYKLSADQGDPPALIRLASYYATGRGGLHRSASEASRLCNLAAHKVPSIADRLPQCWAPRWATQYLSRIAKILEAHKRYPTTAYSLRQQGTVVIDFIIDRQGRLVDSRVHQSSGSAVLDDEALRILHRSQPFPAFPDSSSEQRLSLSTPVRFAIRPCTISPAQTGVSGIPCSPLR